MTENENLHSPSPEEVTDHYASGYEADRLQTGHGKVDCERSRELLKRFLPLPPAVIVDVGGGPGGHACWLARRGYEVHLVDIVPLHVDMARAASARQPATPLASVETGDARTLSVKSETIDAVLLFGPLYHLTKRGDRLKALSEVFRILKPGGVLLAVGISRFASTLDGLRAGFLKDPAFVEIVNGDLKNGYHRNPTGNPDYFMDTFLHHPDELRGELSDAGFEVRGVYGVEGPAWLAPNLDQWWENTNHRNTLLNIARRLETERSLLGISAHMIAVGGKK